MFYTAPSSPPVDVEAIPINSHTLSISWSIPSPEHANGVIRGYIVTLLEVDTMETFSDSANSTSIAFPNLQPSFTYTYRVAARTTDIGPNSPEMHVTLPEDGELYHAKPIYHLTICWRYPGSSIWTSQKP